MGCSQGSELRSPRKMKLSYFDESRSRFPPILSTCLLTRFLFGLYEQHNNDFLFLIFNSTQNASKLGSIFNRVDGASSLIQSSKHPLFSFLSRL